MLTAFGKLLRNIRAKAQISSKEMARQLNISPSYLSAIENGKRNIPIGIEKQLIDLYSLSDAEKEKLENTIFSSSDTVKIDLSELPAVKRRIIIDIALDSFPEDKLNEIRKISGS